MSVNLPKTYQFKMTVSLTSNELVTTELNETELLALFEKVVGQYGAYRDSVLLKVTSLTKES
jgi:hypothetical protein